MDILTFLAPPTPDYATVLVGLLIMQDVLLGLIMALLPVLAQTSSAHHAHAPAAIPAVLTADAIVVYLLLIFKLIFGWKNALILF